MKRIRPLLTTFGVAFGMLGCKSPMALVTTESVAGSGKATTETRAISGVHAVSVSSSGRLEIEQGDTESLTITADDNVLPLLTSEVGDGRLTLGFKRNVSVKSTMPIVYKLTVKTLDEVALAGSGTVNAKGIQTASLKVHSAGSGDFVLEGTADKQEVSIAGSGNFHGESLKGKSGRIDIAGSGNATINTSEKLTANIMGSGSVEYVGNPAVTKSVLGSGKISKR